MAGPIRISILANAKQAKGEIDSVAGKSSKLGGAFGKFAKGGALAFAAVGVAAGAFAKSAVSSASNAQQSLGATETVFGKFAQTIIKRSNEAATAVGLSANEYRELANVTGASLAGAGIPLKKVTGLTGDLTKRAADLSATFGGTTADAVSAIGSLMRGEADPIERYGISIKQSDVAARLAAKGQDKLTGAAKKQAEMQARVDLLMQKSAKSQGAFRREGNTLAHQQQVLGAQFENIKAKVGTLLLPVLTKLLTMVNKNLNPAFRAIGAFLRPVIARVKDFFSGVGKGNGPITQIIGSIKSQFLPVLRNLADLFTSQVLPVITSLVASIRANFLPVLQSMVDTFTGKVLPAVTSLVSYLASRLAPILAQVGEIIATKVVPLVARLAQFFYGTLVPAVVAIAQKVATKLKPVFEQLAATFQSQVLPTVRKLLARFEEWRPTIQKIVMVVVRITGKILEFAAAILAKVLPPAIKFAGWLVKTLVPAVLDGIETVAKIIGKVIDFGKKAYNAGVKAAEFANKVKTKIGEVLTKIGELPGKAKEKLGDLKDDLVQAGKDLIQGFIDGIGDMFDDVQGKLGDLTGKLTSWKGPPARDRVLLRPAGRQIMQGLVDGLLGGFASVQSTLGKVTSRIKAALDRTYDGKQLAAHVKAAQKALKDEYAALVKNAKAQDKVTARLAKAREALKAARAAAADYAATIRQSFLDTASITNLGQTGEGEVTTQNLLSDLKDKLVAAQRFASLIRTLTTQGLNKATLQQLLSAGPEGAMATAEAIAAGGQAAVSEINSLTSQIAAQGTALGDTMASKFYGAGIQAAQGLVKGLESKAKALERVARRLAEALARAIRRALGIASPSRVFRDLGQKTALGLKIGLQDIDVRRAGIRLAETLQGGFGTPALDALMAGGGPRGGNTYQVTVQAPVGSSSADIGRTIVKHIEAFETAGGRRRAA